MNELDPFATLVSAVAAMPDNAYNTDRYLWVLDARDKPCPICSKAFNPSDTHNGCGHSRRPRLYCSPKCATVAYWQRRTGRTDAA